MVMQDIKLTTEKNHLLHEPFRWPCGSGGKAPSTLLGMAGLVMNLFGLTA
jgi:hypothetical protein